MKQSLSKLLNKHGILPTPQRLEVAHALLHKPQHLSAEQLIEKLRGKGSAVSKATVYNTLALLCERELIQSVHADPSRVFYDSTTHRHHHFFNVDSGQLTDIPAEQVEFKKMPELPAGTEPDGIELIIRVRDSKD